MSHKRRFDLVRIDKGEVTTQGFLRAPAALTRTGVFRYRKSDGTWVRELRHPDDVFEAESLASLQMAPVTDDHPKEFVGPANVKQLSIGWVSEAIKADGKLINATVVVADQSAIEKVDAGKVELSCGYYADLIEESGVYEGEAYDLRQKNIRYNHVALVARGRAGPQVRLRVDSDDAEMVDPDETVENPKEDLPMKKIKIDGKEFEVSTEVADAFEAFSKKMEDAVTSAKAGLVPKEDVAEVQKKLDAATAAGDVLQARVDHLEKEAKTKTDSADASVIQKAVQERLRIQGVATQVLDEADVTDEKSDLDLMKAVIMKDDADAKLDGKSDEYIKARFDGIESSLKTRQTRAATLGRTFVDKRVDSDFDANAARQKSMEESRNAWQKPLASQGK